MPCLPPRLAGFTTIAAFVVVTSALAPVRAETATGRRKGGVVEWVTPPTPRGGPLVPSHYVLYLNRSGGAYSPGREDPTANTSSIVSSATAISPWHLSQAEWVYVRECVKDIYAPYAITVTDVEPPPNTPYIESVVAGTAREVKASRGADFLGIAPGTCEPLDRSINFTCAKDFCNAGSCPEEALQFMCEVVAQESGHAFGMDHQRSCEDPMSYFSSCVQRRRFTDSDDTCGEDGPRPCKCGGPTQNSHRHMLQWAGPADGVPPTLSVTAPRDGDTVAAEFATTFAAGDETRLDRVELWIDGQMIAFDDDNTLTLAGPRILRPGTHTVEIKAIDGGENVTAVAISVTSLPECGDGVGDCPEGEACDGGVCLGAIGAPCDDASSCAGGVCAASVDNLSQFCTAYCEVGDGTCPGGFTCTQPEFGSAQCQASGGGGGGCAIGRRTGAGATGALLLTMALLLQTSRARRRRRTRS